MYINIVSVPNEVIYILAYYIHVCKQNVEKRSKIFSLYLLGMAFFVIRNLREKVVFLR